MAQSHGQRTRQLIELIDVLPTLVELAQLSLPTNQVILPPTPAVSNEGGSSPLLDPLPAVFWPWVSAWGSMEPSRPGGENAQKTRKNGEKMGEIWPKKCEQGRDRTDHLT